MTAAISVICADANSQPRAGRAPMFTPQVYGNEHQQRETRLAETSATCGFGRGQDRWSSLN
ncbi:hypothetical protein JG688_00009283 [Phytophthora aleatoria]|uniref:Uncharacterized protein n=1 Tax=Phytophthora aleatoria TaxID=2496075 RepID=A0A8J5M2H6_9STRA|nr:hypothetical protein JG688_00009283 [Phytophthora aleatoria]